MHVLNRSVAVIRPKQPYLDWVRTLGPYYESLEDLASQGRAILVPEASSSEEVLSLLEELTPKLFEIELEAWQPGKVNWPKHLDFETFRDWFEIDVQLLVVDSVGAPIQTEPYE